MALDRADAKIFDTLKQNGQLDNTMIIFLTDNALFWGEHRMTQKNSLYEEGVHTPFAVRYPPLIPKPVVENRLVSTLDIPPTILQLAGIPIPSNMDGLSLVNLFDGGPWRNALLLEGWPPAEYMLPSTPNVMFMQKQRVTSLSSMICKQTPMNWATRSMIRSTRQLFSN